MASHLPAEQPLAPSRTGRLSRLRWRPPPSPARLSQRTGTVVRVLLLSGLVGAMYLVDRRLHGLPSTTWVAYVLPILLAPRLMPAPLAVAFITATIALAWTDALSVVAFTWDDALKACVLFSVGLYGIRDVQRERALEEAKSRLLRLVSHELRTPLHHIKGFASTLLQTDLEWDRTTQQECLQAIEQNADRLTRLVESLLDMARAADGRIQPHVERCAPAALVQGALGAARVARGDHPLELEIPPTLPDVRADPIYVQRVLLNLLDNAAKYSPPGRPIRIRASVERGSVVLRVADEGPGVPANERQRIFGSFQRGQASNLTHAPGAGLGLAIARELLAAQGGRIWVEPNRPRGSVFAVSLPADEAAAPLPARLWRAARG
ncbi:MAG TPA: ATP-binding protein [Chloroflexota bacterium]|jgi:signal transduction histidine kinase